MPKNHQTGNAHYTIHVPTHDPHGNRLIDLTAMGAQSLQSKIPRHLHDVHTEGPHLTHPYRHMKIFAVDTPETDSHVKNLAADMAAQSGHPSIFMHKDSMQGSQPWTITNKAFNGMPADPSLVEAPVAPYAATVAPASAI
jgi:hypothetical protein